MELITCLFAEKAPREVGAAIFSATC